MEEAYVQDSLDHLLYHSHIVVGLGPLRIGEVEVETWRRVACFLVLSPPLDIVLGKSTNFSKFIRMEVEAEAREGRLPLGQVFERVAS